MVQPEIQTTNSLVDNLKVLGDREGVMDELSKRGISAPKGKAWARRATIERERE